ncbi:MAG: hypothetical protein H6817_01860 [Phycisphaerales bacterium]|nr:hypothetical protein [Phycisphaerales bacterium]
MPITENTNIYVGASRGVLRIGIIEVLDLNNPPAESDKGFGDFRYSAKNITYRMWPGNAYSPPTFAGAGGSGMRARTFSTPIWSMIAVFGAYPCIAFLRGPIRSMLRARRGDCHRCGYDLTGVETQRCPECGRRFDMNNRARAAAKHRVRMERSARWCEIYMTQRRRRRFAHVAFILAIGLLLLWPLSYVRPAFRTPWFNCRIVWGTIAIFGRSQIDPEDRDFDTSIDGYVSLETCWWPFDMVDAVNGWLIIPLWMLAGGVGVVWFFLYRPDRHRYAKKHGASSVGERAPAVDASIQADATGV